jgi:hypothetical protein
MLLEDLLRTFDASDPSFERLKQAAESIKEVAEYCNDQRREHERQFNTRQAIKELHLKNFAAPNRVLLHEERKTGMKLAQDNTQSFYIPNDGVPLEKKRTASMFSIPTGMRKHTIREDKCDVYIFSDIMVTVANKFPKDVIKFVPLKEGVKDPRRKTVTSSVKLDTIDLKILITVEAGDRKDDIVATLICANEKQKNEVVDVLQQCISV